MTESEISLDVQMPDGHKLSGNRTELDNKKLATSSDMVIERVKASLPIYRRRILSISLGLFIISFLIAAVYFRGTIFVFDEPFVTIILILSIPLLFNHKYCENPLQAIVYFLQQKPHEYSVLKRKIGNYWFAYEAELNYLEESGQISYSYTGKKDTRVISLVDNES